MENCNEKIYCKKIEFKDDSKNPVYGIVVDQDDNYVHFKTRKGTYQLSHDSIKVIEPTKIIFEGGEQDD